MTSARRSRATARSRSAPRERSAGNSPSRHPAGAEGPDHFTRVNQAVPDLRDAPLRRFTTTPLLELAWSLRASVSADDAFHVALARALRCPLLTGDLRLARAPGLGVAVLTA